MNAVNKTSVCALLAHITRIIPLGVEVRDVAVSEGGMGFWLDSAKGESTKAVVQMCCWPTTEEEGEQPGGWHIAVRTAQGFKFVAEWVAQMEDENADYLAAWFSVAANRTGNCYWLEPLEVVEVLED